MSTFSLLYVSRSLVAPGRAEDAITDIIATSMVRNGREDITGALLYSGTHFVQILEGGVPAVLRLMDGIRRDPRHTDVDVLELRVSAARIFRDWRMVYFGGELSIRLHVQKLLLARDGQVNLPIAVHEMRRLMRDFARALRAG